MFLVISLGKKGYLGKGKENLKMSFNLGVLFFHMFSMYLCLKLCSLSHDPCQSHSSYVVSPPLAYNALDLSHTICQMFIMNCAIRSIW